MNDSINDYMKKMQQIDDMIKKTLSIQQKHMPQKYSNIETTLKLLHNLISTFKKRADNFEEQLKSRAKIDDIGHQIQYHRQRIVQCQRMSQNICAKITNKKIKVKQDEQKVLQLRKQILILKADNVKKILRLQQIQKIQTKKKQKQNMDNKKMTWKMKTQYNRSFYHDIDKTNIKTRQLSLLIKDKEDLTALVNQKLERKIKLGNLINEAFVYMKGKLVEKQRKSNANGMNGSLMFKILQNDKPAYLKPLRDRKLMIYDVLKSKHQNYVKSQRICKDLTDVTQQQFMEFTNFQVMGMIQLAGGYKKVLDNIWKSDMNQIHKDLEDTKTNATIQQQFQ